MTTDSGSAVLVDGTTTLSQSDLRRARILLTTFAAFAGSSYLFSRGVASGTSTYAFALHGLAAASILLLLLDRHNGYRTPRLFLGALLFCGVGTAVTPFLFLLGTKTVTPALGSILVISNALLIALLARMLGRKHFTKLQVVALVAGFFGVATISYLRGAIGGNGFGVTTLLLASALIAMMTIVMEPMVKTMGGVASSKRVFALSFAFGLFFATLFDVPLFYSVKQSALGLLFGLVCLGTPITLFNVGMSMVGSADAANFKLLIPLFALVYGALILGEIPDGPVAVVGLATVASVALYQWSSHNHGNSKAS